MTCADSPAIQYLNIHNIFGIFVKTLSTNMGDRNKLMKNIDGYAEKENMRIGKTFWDCFPYVPRRYILSFFLFLGTANSFAVRVNFNVAIVAMVNDTEDETANGTMCVGQMQARNRTQNMDEFSWSPTLQTLLLGAFYYGYPVLQPLGGYLADRFGARWLVASTGIIAGIFNLLLPTIASWNPYALIVLRALVGLGQGCMWPASASMISVWVPDRERATLFAMVNGGAAIGTIISQSVSGILCYGDFLGGWPASFYLFGILSSVWGCCFLMVTSSSPSTHPSISEEEKQLIEKDICIVKYRSPPWKCILTSRPFFAFLIISVLHVTAYDIVFTFLPLYMKRVLKYDISQSGILASIPYLSSFFMTVSAGWSADVIKNKGWIGTMWIRRGYTLSGELLQGMCILAISMLGCSKIPVLIFFIMAVTSSSILNGGFHVNVYDIAPRYAGSLYGISNACASLGGFVGPLIVDAITDVSGDLDSWKVLFYIVAATFVTGAIIFCIFGSADLQPWANLSDPPAVDETRPIQDNGRHVDRLSDK